MTVETVIPNVDAPSVNYRQVIQPQNLTGSFIINDTDDHDFKVDGRGKGRMTVVIENPGDQTLTIQVYGMEDDDDDVGDPFVNQIGADWTVTDADDRGYRTISDPFPFYLVRVTSAGAASGSPTCTVHINFASA